MLGNAVLLKRFTCSQAVSDPISCITGTSLLAFGIFYISLFIGNTIHVFSFIFWTSVSDK